MKAGYTNARLIMIRGEGGYFVSKSRTDAEALSSVRDSEYVSEAIQVRTFSKLTQILLQDV